MPISLRTTASARRLGVVAALLFAAPLLGVSSPARAEAPAACTTGTTPSCAPHQNWDCIHGDLNLPHRCDPNDNGCVKEAE